MSIVAGQTITTGDGLMFAQNISLQHINQASTPSGASVYADIACVVECSGTSLIFENFEGSKIEARDITSDWADADSISSVVVLGAYLYLLLVDTGAAPDAFRVYRYDKTNLAAGGTQISFSGATVLTAANVSIIMSSDGTNMYFNFAAGTSANDYAISKYSISGTTFTFVSTTNCGSTANAMQSFHVKSNGDYVGLNINDFFIRRFNSSGTLQATSGRAYISTGLYGFIFIRNFFAYIKYWSSSDPAKNEWCRVSLP